jgi:hypothetical protein
VCAGVRNWNNSIRTRKEKSSQKKENGASEKGSSGKLVIHFKEKTTKALHGYLDQSISDTLSCSIEGLFWVKLEW